MRKKSKNRSGYTDSEIFEYKPSGKKVGKKSSFRSIFGNIAEWFKNVFAVIKDFLISKERAKDRLWLLLCIVFAIIMWLYAYSENRNVEVTRIDSGNNYVSEYISCDNALDYRSL